MNGLSPDQRHKHVDKLCMGLNNSPKSLFLNEQESLLIF
jgi:hypothetical protein